MNEHMFFLNFSIFINLSKHLPHKNNKKYLLGMGVEVVVVDLDDDDDGVGTF